MAKKTAVPTLADALAAAETLTSFLGTLGDSDEEEADDADGEWEVLDREEVEALAIKELRALAEERGIEEKKKADILAALEEGGHFGDGDEDEEDGEDDEDEDSDEDEDEDEEGEYDRDELAELDLKALRALAIEEGASKSDVKGLDQDALIDLIMGDDEEGDDDEDEDEDGDEEDEETEELDEDALNDMSVKELTALAKELEIKVPAKSLKAAKNDKAKKKILVEAILASGDEEE